MSKGAEIRKKFLDYFAKLDHIVRPSTSLVPTDPTLLFTVAGMVPFKPFFLGGKKLPFRRACSSQRCLRTNDLERVGLTSRHHTFFEMLGNFSFGDYFKREAIEWSWEFLTEELGLPASKLLVSIYKEDDEAEEIWHRKIGLPLSRIIRLGEENNFWKMGETGPCGPCSEIIFDQGEEVGCGRKTCGVECECDRYLELWNLVFTQFDLDESGHLNPLPQKNIDTGMGLERLVAVVQGVKTNFDTDLLRPIIDYTSELSGTPYGAREDVDVSLRVIADHSRAITYLIYDGVFPSNEERGYVLRSLIRRAVCKGRSLGLMEPFLYQLIAVVIKAMDTKDLIKEREHISRIVRLEEEKFIHTLERTRPLLSDLVERYKKRGERVIAGDEIFRLYDTHGVPQEIIEEAATKAGLLLDKRGFEKAMDEQRSRARRAGLKVVAEEERDFGGMETQFVGYETLEASSQILALKKDGKPIQSASTGDKIDVVLERTPFYAERGGQIGDTGIMVGKEGIEVEVLNSLPSYDKKTTIHKALVKRGTINLHDEVVAKVDPKRRKAICRSHTATHLLQATLRNILGSHVKQSGSLVAPDRLRFDFTHLAPLDERELLRVEEIVNEQIREGFEIKTFFTTKEEAIKQGAIALFEEEYAEWVRVVKIGDISMELCGGTHLRCSGEVGLFKIVGEVGVAAGVRRIEALVGESAYRLVLKREEIIRALSEELKVEPDGVLLRMRRILEEVKEAERQLDRMRRESMRLKVSDLLSEALQIGDIKVVCAKVEEVDSSLLREMADSLISKLKSGVVVLGTIKEGRALLVSKVTEDLTSKIHAGTFVREIAKVVGGGGGGRADMGEAGGRDFSKLDEALKGGIELIRNKLR